MSDQDRNSQDRRRSIPSWDRGGGRPMSDKSLYERLGGVFAIAAVVDHFSDAVVRNAVAGQGSDNPALREWHTAELGRLPGLKFMRTLWVCDVAGGPFEYVGTHRATTRSASRRRIAGWASRPSSSMRSPASWPTRSTTLAFRRRKVRGPGGLLGPQGRGHRGIDGRRRLITKAARRSPGRPWETPRRCSERDRRPASSRARPLRQDGSPSSA